MPLPWKKGKFSKIVADRIQSAKRGGSLETGFPTSLVHLFVKNRDGLKRSSKKKKDRKPDVEQIPGEPCPVFASPARSVSSSEPFPQMFTQSPTISRSSSFSSSPAIWRTPPRQSFSGSPAPIESSSAAVSDSDRAEAADVKGILIAILKVFFVVALGLGTKQFVVGLIISAFSLIFMEFVGKYLCRLLKPCQQAQISLRHFLEQVLRVTRIRNDQTHQRCSIEGKSKQNQIEEEKPSSSIRLSKPNHSHLKPPRGKEMPRTLSDSCSIHLKQESEESPIGGSLSHCRSFNWLTESMIREEAAEKNHHHHHHHRSGSSKFKSKIIKMLTPKKKDKIEDPIPDSDQKTSKNRSSRLKSKIRMFVMPNRLTKDPKKKPTQTNEQNNQLPNFVAIEEPNIVCYNEEQSCIPRSRVMPTYDEDREVGAASAEERRNDCGEKTNRSRGCSVFLLPIILMGLVGGRSWAIALTLAWIFSWKLTAWILWKSSFSSSSSRSCS